VSGIKNNKENIENKFIRLLGLIISNLEEFNQIQDEQLASLKDGNDSLFIKLIEQEGRLFRNFKRLNRLEKRIKENLDAFYNLDPVKKQTLTASRLTITSLLKEKESLLSVILKKKEELQPIVEESFSRLKKDYLRANVKRQIGDWEN
jgi:hypothetical protein